jgi:hypothetical protein
MFDDHRYWRISLFLVGLVTSLVSVIGLFNVCFSPPTDFIKALFIPITFAIDILVGLRYIDYSFATYEEREDGKLVLYYY